MNVTPIRIILVDDHQLVRESWKMLLQNDSRFEIIADFGNGNSAIEQAEKLVPHIMLVDINMNPMNGFDLTKKICARFPSIKIIGLSINNQPEYAMRMIRSGGYGYLTKTSGTNEIIHGILEVHTGKKYICEEIRNQLSPEAINEIG